jgi:outer membrane protein TolC
VRSFSQPDVLPSVVLKAARPQLAALQLPAGVRMELGGELEGSAEVQGSVNIALMVSMIGVFLILLFQFRNARQPLVVMVSIPLALVGAALGLVITHNPFTYTANLGVNALTGVVVRNAIILVDYANELRRTGMAIEAAALLAGRRRLRPIFLTTMAAALGVTPMILSRSPLWSPMASVIAVGLVTSMIFTLIVVPVLYAVVEQRVERRSARRAAAHEVPAATAGEHSLMGPAIAAATRAAGVAGLVAAMLVLPPALGAQTVGPQADSSRQAVAPRVLTLDDAIDLALRRSTATRVAAARRDGAAAHRRGAVADYLPRLALSGNRIQGNSRTTIVIPQGMLGHDGTGAPVPGDDRRFQQGATMLTLGQLTLTQPVTQLYRIRQENALAVAQERGAEAAQAQAARDIALGVERLYVATLIAREKTSAMQVALAARRQQVVDANVSLQAGAIISAQADAARAGALEAEFALVAARNEADDLETELRDLLDLSMETPIVLSTPSADTMSTRRLADYVALAIANSPEVAAATAQQHQASRAVALANSDYIPDVGVGVTYTYQRGVPFLPDNSAALVIQGSWTVLDFGKRASVRRERQADEQAASIALEHARSRAAVEVEKAFRKAERAEQAALAARAAFEARDGAARVAVDQQGRGIVAVAFRADADAARAMARAKVVEAELGAQLARDELAYAAGTDRVSGSRLDRGSQRPLARIESRP